MDNTDFDSIPASALNYSSRHLLGQYLNPTQNLLSKDGFSRDYNGLAEQMNLQYNTVRNLERSDNVTMAILDAWSVEKDANIGKLVRFLVNMGRHDVIEDMKARFEKDAQVYLNNLENQRANPIPDTENNEITFNNARTFYTEEEAEFICNLLRSKKAIIVVSPLMLQIQTDSALQIQKGHANSLGLVESSKMLHKKVTIFEGNITTLVVDAMVNSTDAGLSGSGGVDRAIHRAAGKDLFYECKSLGLLKLGEAKVTSGYNLPSKFIIHTSGPSNNERKFLEDCYWNSLKAAVESGARTISFPCIATGIKGYENKNAAHVALRTVKKFLEKRGSAVDCIVFCLYLSEDVNIYKELMKEYFPVRYEIPNDY